jgi:hypothetical protein
MPFQYKDIKVYQSRANEIFLFDANIWIYYHDQTRNKGYQKPYNSFLNNLLKKKDDPEVLLPGCIMSEVLNRLLKDKYVNRFLQSAEGKLALLDNPVDDKDVFKKVYRAHLRYKLDRDSIYNSIFSYSENLFLISDDFNKVNLDELTTAFTDLEFNDWTILELAKLQRATIITDDADFKVENYPILTNNTSLLSLQTNF